MSRGSLENPMAILYGQHRRRKGYRPTPAGDLQLIDLFLGEMRAERLFHAGCIQISDHTANYRDDAQAELSPWQRHDLDRMLCLAAFHLLDQKSYYQSDYLFADRRSYDSRCDRCGHRMADPPEAAIEVYDDNYARTLCLPCAVGQEHAGKLTSPETARSYLSEHYLGQLDF